VYACTATNSLPRTTCVFCFVLRCAAFSYLGYGLMAARAKVIDAGVGAEKGHPCFAKGKPITYSYGDKEYQVREVVEAGDFKRCAATIFKALDHDKDCGQPKVGRRKGGNSCTGVQRERGAAAGMAGMRAAGVHGAMCWFQPAPAPAPDALLGVWWWIGLVCQAPPHQAHFMTATAICWCCCRRRAASAAPGVASRGV
jgi:hypothetical protein